VNEQYPRNGLLTVRTFDTVAAQPRDTDPHADVERSQQPRSAIGGIAPERAGET
jgi:hypothetical protein